MVLEDGSEGSLDGDRLESGLPSLAASADGCDNGGVDKAG